MSARDEREYLAELLEEEQESGRWAESPDADLYGFMADKVLAAGYRKPRTITTAEELAALAEGAVIRSDEGGVFEALEAWNRDESKYGIQWRETGSSWRLESHEIALPATVLHEPSA